MTLSDPSLRSVVPPTEPSPVLGSAKSYQSSFAAVGGRELEVLAKDGTQSVLCLGLYHNDAYELFVPAMAVARVSIALDRCNLTGAVGGERLKQCVTRRNAAFFIPAGAEARWIKDAPGRHLNIYFRAEAFDGGDTDAARFTEDMQLFNAVVPGVRLLADELTTELDRQAPMVAEAVDSLARLLLVRLARYRSESAASRNPLSPKTLQRLRDYVEAQLSEPILVADLAAVAGLPTNRFARAFTDYCGRSPHQFVLCLRLARVLRLLRGTRLGIAEVALTCGFASQQHLTRTMRQRLNITPASYRDRVRGTSPCVVKASWSSQLPGVAHPQVSYSAGSISCTSTPSIGSSAPSHDRSASAARVWE